MFAIVEQKPLVAFSNSIGPPLTLGTKNVRLNLSFVLLEVRQVDEVVTLTIITINIIIISFVLLEVRKLDEVASTSSSLRFHSRF